MTQKNKLILFYVFTFGIGYIVAKQKVNKIKKVENNILSNTTVPNTKINKIIEVLGDTNNIVSIESTINNIKVTTNNINLVKQSELKQLGATGSFVNGNKITIIFGDESNSIATQIQTQITNK